MASTPIIPLNDAASMSGDRVDDRGRTLYRRAGWALTAAAWAYVIAIPVYFKFGGLTPPQLELISSWIALPVQAASILIGAWLLAGKGWVEAPRRTVAWLVLGFTAVNIFGTFVWNLLRDSVERESLSLPDGIYLSDYWILVIALAQVYRNGGGNFKQPRFWLDGVIMMAVQLIVVWSYFLAPTNSHGLDHDITWGAAGAYSLTLAGMTSMSAVLLLQLPTYRRRYGTLFLVAAALSIVASEINWLAAWLMDYDAAMPYANYGDVVCFACIISGAAAAPSQPALPPAGVNAERQVYSFFPALTGLLAIALTAGTLATTTRVNAWILAALVTLCAQLLVTRQASVRKELRELNRSIAAQEADARLTELVRRSNDLIVVIDGAGVISFASPAAESLLGLPAHQLQGSPAVSLFGAVHETAVHRCLDQARGSAALIDGTELKIEHAVGGTRALKITASNQLDNPLIHGIVLTVHDVTDQRALEREVLDIATRERVRLCADLHDGLGQELTGIALLLQAAATAPDPDAGRQRAHLLSIVSYVNRAIGAARDLARGYSPLHVVRGSLGGALRRFAQESSSVIPITLKFDAGFDDRVIGDFAADHLYRIVQEAVANAVRYSGGTHIDIVMSYADGWLALCIADDGMGLGRRAPEDRGLGLRLMEYRARLVGGTLRTGSPSGRGTWVEVSVPLPQPGLPALS